ncbi:MAG: ATP-dependent Clp protease ATP-binding subunit [Deltaproteobacteria bacterium]|nr:ATP-dependent Clp protease ATP-binding subunit [Deltaproteobacteria bacterium]
MQQIIHSGTASSGPKDHGWGGSARAFIERANTIAKDRSARVSTLHLAAAWIEQGGEPARALVQRNCSTEDLRNAQKTLSDGAGTIERIQSRARRIAAERKADIASIDVLIAAMTDKQSALCAWLSRSGVDAQTVAEEVYKATLRVTNARAGSSAIAKSEAKQAPVVSSQHGRDSSASDAPRPANPRLGRHPAVLPPPDPSKLLGATARNQSATQSATPSARNGGKQTKGNAKTPPAKTQYDIDPRTHPAVALFARNLSAECARGSLEPVVGREREVQRVLDAVGRREGRGALITGAPGVGKSTLLRALARTHESRCVLVLRHADIAAQTRGPSGLERARKLVEELVQLGDRVIIALDPVAPWFLTRDLPDDVVLELRAALSSGKLAWIGVATPEEARKLIECEPWTDRGTQRVALDEPAGESLSAMVEAYSPLITQHHGVLAEKSVLSFAAELSERYLGGRAQPDRALSVIDLALSRAHRTQAPALSREMVATVVAELGDLPVDRVASTDHERLISLESTLADKVVGHAAVLSRVAHTLRRNAVGFRGNRPIGTFLFLGPTGVGKTECAKAIAEALFPGASAMTRFDMAEFSEAHTVARLLGAPPGYVGFHEGGQLTDAVRRKPYQLILLDEIEKAHRDVLESLLALLDEGRMTDGRGRTADFRNTVIVMTSNLGADVFEAKPEKKSRAIGFGNDSARAVSPIDDDTLSKIERVRDTARASMPPELWNRIDEPIVFAPLAREELREIARRMLSVSFERLRRERGVTLTAGAGLIELLLDQGGYEPSLGARPMRRAIARLVEAPLADAVLRQKLVSGDVAVVDTREGEVDILVTPRAIA